MGMVQVGQDPKTNMESVAQVSLLLCITILVLQVLLLIQELYLLGLLETLLIRVVHGIFSQSVKLLSLLENHGKCMMQVY